MVSESFASLFGWVVQFKRIRIEPLPLPHLRHIALFLVPFEAPVFRLQFFRVRQFSMVFCLHSALPQGVSPAARSLADGSCLLPMKGLCSAQSWRPFFGDIIIVHRRRQKAARLTVSRCFKSTTTPEKIHSDRSHEKRHNCHYNCHYETGWCSTGSSKFVFINVLGYLSSVQLHFYKQNRKSQVWSLVYVVCVQYSDSCDPIYYIRCISFNVAVACAILLATLDSYGFLQGSLDSSEVPIVAQCCTNIKKYKTLSWVLRNSWC